MRHGLPFATAVFLGLATIAASPASAKCTRLAFSVNDYGKPIEDAKNMLDKYIATEMKKKGIAKYRTGKKDVNCEFFITLLVVDEYTCKAEADVCWDEAQPGAAPLQAQAPGAPPAAKDAKAPPAAKAIVPTASAKAAVPAAPKAGAKSAKALTAAAAASDAPPAAAPPAAVTPVETVADPAAPEAAAATAAATPVEEPAAAPEQGQDQIQIEAADPAQAAETAGEDGPPPDTAATETGAIEKYAAPKKIVIPAPMQVKRGLPVEPGAADAKSPSAPAQ